MFAIVEEVIIDMNIVKFLSNIYTMNHKESILNTYWQSHHKHIIKDISQLLGSLKHFTTPQHDNKISGQNC